MNANNRFEWAVETLNISEHDTLLEIGCGTGILLEQIARKLRSGNITGIDRSGAMITKAEKRNEHFIKQGKVSFIQCEFARLIPGSKTYNKIFAFNVNTFWKNGAAELGIIKTMLETNGCFFLFHQPPHEKLVQEILEKTRAQLKKNDFKIISIARKKFEPASAFCITTQPG